MLSTTLITLISMAVAVSAVPALEFEVTGPAAVDTIDNLKVIASLKNTGDEAVKVLTDPRGPLSKLPTNTFSITDGAGARPVFNGIKVKYAPTVAAKLGAFTLLKPGQTVTVEHDLAEAYNFTSSGAGTYDIEASNKFLIVNEDSTVSTIYASSSSAHTARISGKLSASRRPSPSLTKRATFNGCSTSRQSSISSGASAAESYASAAYSYLASHTAASPRYTTWFGTYTDSRHSTVLSHFQKIDSNTFSTFTYDCTCTDSGTYAYVYPSDFGRIYFCGAFWNAPTTGTDSKAGTIIHESSHFTANGGTDDYAYGQTAAKNLAISNPGNAVFNADNHEYFAENTPALS